MTEYRPVLKALLGSLGENAQASEPIVVAETIWNAVTHGTDRLRYRAGPYAVALRVNRKALDDATFIGGVKAQLGLDNL